MILQILKKDARRLWPAILLSLVVLASLAWHDSRRSDWIAGGIEQQLTLLVPAVWAFLIGLAVEQDPIAGDRQFWVTRPYRRGALLGAKLLFAVLFVHVPSLLADCCILAGRGFSPAEYAGRLLAKQLMLALALTLPAMALATLVRNFKHFLLAAVGVVTVALLAGEWRPWATVRWAVFETARWQSVFILLGCAAAVVLPLSYLRRRITISRTVAVAAGCITCLVFVLFAPQSALGVRSAIAGRPATLSVRLDPRPPLLARLASTQATIPIAVEGVPEGAQVSLLPLWSELSGKTRAYRETSYRASESPYWISITSPDFNSNFISPTSIVLRMNPAVLQELASGPVTIRGEAAATIYRTGQPLTLRPSDSGRRADGARCMTELTQDRLGQERIKIECESPRLDPGGMRVRATVPGGAVDWFAGRPFAPRPRSILLSPVDRDEAYINAVANPRQMDRFFVPSEILSRAQVEITPTITLGEVAVRYELRDLDLRKFLGLPIAFKRGN